MPSTVRNDRRGFRRSTSSASAIASLNSAESAPFLPIATLSLPDYSARNATTGSSLAAFAAGYTPKNSPTLVATINPISTDQICTELGSAVVKVTIFASRMPRATPQIPPTNSNRRRFDQELHPDIALPRAKGFSQSDLPGPLRHRNEHDVHDHDSAHDQRD